MRLAGARRAALLAALPALLALLAWAVAVQHAVGPARVVAGVLLAFVLPGAAGTAALFPDRGPSRIERLVLTPALSLAVLVLGGLLVDVLGLHLVAGTWGGLSAVVTVLLAGVGYLRWRRGARSAGPVGAGDERQGEGTPRDGPPGVGAPGVGAPGAGGPGAGPVTSSAGGWRTVWRLAPLVVAVALLGGAGWIGMHSATTQREAPFTALSIVPDDDPEPTDQVRPVTVAVDCREVAATRYTLKVRAAAGPSWQFPLLLQPGEVWKRDLQVPIVGQTTADLFKGDGAKPYRSVFVSGQQ